MRTWLMVFVTAAAVVLLPHVVLADDAEKPAAEGPKVEKPDRPEATADRPGPPRGPEGRPSGRRRPGGPEARPQRPTGPRGPAAGRGRPSAGRGPVAGRGRPDFGRGPEARGGRPGGFRGPVAGGPIPGPPFHHGMRPPWHPVPRPGVRGYGAGLPRPAVVFARLDRDGDKKLSLEEFTAGMRRIHAVLAARGRSFGSMAARAHHGRGPQAQPDKGRGSGRQGRSAENRRPAERGPSGDSPRSPRKAPSRESLWW